jgi:5'-3' exonuclease
MPIFSKILVDVSQLFHANFHMFKNMSSIIDDVVIPTGGIYGFLRSLNVIQRDFGNSELTDYYFLLDNFSSKDTLRKSLSSEYKIDRKKYEPEFYRAIDFLNLILLNYSDHFYSIQIPSMEADDLPQTLLKIFDKNEKVLVVSNDLDYSRVISDNVFWYSQKQIFDKTLFKEKYGFIPTKESIILFKSIRGDSSDNIDGAIKGIRTTDLLIILEKYKDVYEIIDKCNIDPLLFKYKDKIIENKAKLILNSQLIDFLDISEDLIKVNTYQGKFSPNTLRSLYKLLGLKIADVDPRLMQSFPESLPSIDVKDFFSFQQVDRA